MILRNHSNPAFTRVAQIMGDDIQSSLKVTGDNVADLLIDGFKRKRKTPINEAAKIVKKSYADNDLSEKNAARLLKIMNRGANEVGDSKLLSRNPRVSRILKNVNDTVELSAEKYIQRIVGPRAQQMLKKGHTEAAVQAKIHSMMEDAQYYWNNVSNTATSRMFNYGGMISAEGMGLTKLTYHAVLDDVTTEFCQNIDGKTILLANAIVKAETVLMQTPEEMLADDYWSRVKNLSDLSSASIVKSGLTLPPFHGNCRTNPEFH